ncbi:MAG: biotin--[acetyl-CoA-carboxylase] ligase [Actinomycetota bacterium]
MRVMKMSLDEVLYFLKDKKGEYVSGEYLSKRLSLSRTAIWKQIQTLKSQGYKIDASPRLGYRLCFVPNLLLPVEIRYKLSTKILGKEIHHFKEVGSTNDIAKDLAIRGAPEGTIVVAEGQTRGRGRLDRRWFSPPGGIWISLILRPSMSPADIPKITLMTSVAVAKAIGEVTGLRVEIKWPNDILLRGKKVAGILTEMGAETDRLNFVVVGIGINANVDIFPPDLEPHATSVRRVLGESVDRLKLLRCLLGRLERKYIRLQEGRFKGILNEWKELCATLDAQVKISTVDGEIQGKAIGVDEHGALILKLASGKTKTIYAGDVTILREA